GSARAGRRDVRQPDDVHGRRPRRRARRPRCPAHPAGGVALELLLLPRGAAAAGLPVVVLPARPRGPRARPRRPLSGLYADLGEPRLGGARRPAVPQRRPRRRRRARLPRRRPDDPRAVPRGALFGAFRRAPAAPGVTTAPAGTFSG